MSCGCQERKAWLNGRRPGLGDAVERGLELAAGALVLAGVVWLLRSGVTGE